MQKEANGELGNLKNFGVKIKLHAKSQKIQHAISFTLIHYINFGTLVIVGTPNYDL